MLSVTVVGGLGAAVASQSKPNCPRGHLGELAANVVEPAPIQEIGQGLMAGALQKGSTRSFGGRANASMAAARRALTETHKAAPRPKPSRTSAFQDSASMQAIAAARTGATRMNIRGGGALADRQLSELRFHASNDNDGRKADIGRITLECPQWVVCRRSASWPLRVESRHRAAPGLKHFGMLTPHRFSVVQPIAKIKILGFLMNLTGTQATPKRPQFEREGNVHEKNHHRGSRRVRAAFRSGCSKERD